MSEPPRNNQEIQWAGAGVAALAVAMLLASLLAMLLASPFASAAPAGGQNESELQVAGTAAGSENMSKFEARRIRQRCQDRASGQQERDKAAALKSCFQAQLTVRRIWKECKRNLGDHAKEEALKACVAEKVRQK